jgi:hypothetical protein
MRAPWEAQAVKHASYRHAVSWIAANDGSGDDDAKDETTVSGMVTVLLVADIFAVDAGEVAKAVVKYRTTNE